MIKKTKAFTKKKCLTPRKKQIISLKLFQYKKECEIRRNFKRIDDTLKIKQKLLELKYKNCRFVYNLDQKYFYWQIKTFTRKHWLVCPHVEICYHSDESPCFSSLFNIPFMNTSRFFFKSKQSYKFVYFKKRDVTIYERRSKKIISYHIECENLISKNLYYYYSKLLKATRKSYVPKIPSVKTIRYEKIKLNEIVYYAIKLNGTKRIYSFLNSDRDLNFTTSENYYCIEQFKDCSVIVDVCNPLLNPIDRVCHLKYLRNKYDTLLWKDHKILVQFFSINFVNNFNLYELMRNSTSLLQHELPSDGIILISHNEVYKLKPLFKNTIDLMLVSKNYFSDKEGNIYEYINNKYKKLKKKYIYEGFYNFNKFFVHKKRNDKLFPNAYKTIQSNMEQLNHPLFAISLV